MPLAFLPSGCIELLNREMFEAGWHSLNIFPDLPRICSFFVMEN